MFLYKCYLDQTSILYKSSLDLLRFLGSDNHDTYFLNKDRQRLMYEILATTAYGKRKRAEIGIERLVEEGVYTAAFPLHDVSNSLPLIFLRCKIYYA